MLAWHPLLYTLQTLLAGEAVYLVGGTVRDFFLQRPFHDIDLATSGDGRAIARKIANALGSDYYPLDAERQVGRVLVEWEGKRFTIDVARFRGADLLTDLQERDFTINALAFALQDLQRLIDPLNGLQAIRDKVIALCNPASIRHDPVRALRAVRYGIDLKMRLLPETLRAVRQDGAMLSQVSAERVRDEFFKILSTSKPASGLTLLDQVGLLGIILPEVEALKGLTQSPPHVFDVWRHTLSVVEFLDRVLHTISPRRVEEEVKNFAFGMIALYLPHLRAGLQEHLDTPISTERSLPALLTLAALLHDIAKPHTRSQDEQGRIHFYEHEHKGAEIARQIGIRLRLSNDEIDRLELIIRHHLRPKLLHQNKKVSRRAVYRFWRDLGGGGVDVCLLSLADFLGTYGASLPLEAWLSFIEVQKTLLEGYFIQRAELVDLSPLVDGNALMQHFTLKPGPLIGEILAALREAQALGEISTVDEALVWAAQWLAGSADYPAKS